MYFIVHARLYCLTDLSYIFFLGCHRLSYDLALILCAGSFSTSLLFWVRCCSHGAIAVILCPVLWFFSLFAACGHISCFWCVHKSMSGLRESHCPLCRQPYHHFPTICQMLHFLLFKMSPVAYQRREIQIRGQVCCGWL